MFLLWLQPRRCTSSSRCASSTRGTRTAAIVATMCYRTRYVHLRAVCQNDPLISCALCSSAVGSPQVPREARRSTPRHALPQGCTQASVSLRDVDPFYTCRRCCCRYKPTGYSDYDIDGRPIGTGSRTRERYHHLNMYSLLLFN